MTRAVLLLATAMVAASLGVAGQQNPAGAPNGPQNNSDNSAQRTVTISGCLNSAGAGVYTLSDSESATYTLAGNTDTLQGHVGQEIEVTGQKTFASENSVNTSAPGANSAPTIQVVKTRFVADHCTSSGGSQANPSGSGSTSRIGSASNTGAHLQDVAQTQTSSDLNNGQLPQTSTILPLLGLIGLGSLVAGFFARR